MRQLDIPGLASTLLLVLLVAVCSLQAPSVHAISQQDAGVHDWHLPLIGQPHASPELGARFHYPAGRTKAAVSALVYVATEKNVLAAVEPRLGDVGEEAKEGWCTVIREQVVDEELTADFSISLSLAAPVPERPGTASLRAAR